MVRSKLGEHGWETDSVSGCQDAVASTRGAASGFAIRAPLEPVTDAPAVKPVVATSQSFMPLYDNDNDNDNFYS